MADELDVTARDELTSHFRELTGASMDEAIEYLAATGWDLHAAMESFYEDQEEAGPESSSAVAEASAPAEPAYTGPRTLDGRPAPHSTMPSSLPSRKPQKKTGLATLSSLSSGGGGGGGGGPHHHHDDDDDDDDDDEASGRGGPRDLFAGGEKSGLAVQDPSMGGPASRAQKMIKDIIAKAKA